MRRQRLMTLIDFERWLRVTRVVIVIQPFEIVPCSCGDMNCHGWRLIRAASAVVLAACLVCSGVARAQDVAGAWAPEHRQAADWISTAAVGAQVGLDLAHSLRATDRKHALTCQALRLGITVGLSELTKAFIHEPRPDGSDTKSYWSEHTAVAAASAGWNVTIGIPLTALAGSLRPAANKHHWHDVAIGAAVGGIVGYSVCKAP